MEEGLRKDQVSVVPELSVFIVCLSVPFSSCVCIYIYISICLSVFHTCLSLCPPSCHWGLFHHWLAFEKQVLLSSPYCLTTFTITHTHNPFHFSQGRCILIPLTIHHLIISRFLYSSIHPWFVLCSADAVEIGTEVSQASDESKYH